MRQAELPKAKSQKRPRKRTLLASTDHCQAGDYPSSGWDGATEETMFIISPSSTPAISTSPLL